MRSRSSATRGGPPAALLTPAPGLAPRAHGAPSTARRHDPSLIAVLTATLSATTTITATPNAASRRHDQRTGRSPRLRRCRGCASTRSRVVRLEGREAHDEAGCGCKSAGNGAGRLHARAAREIATDRDCD